VPDLRPLVLLPERFRAIFESLVNETLRSMAAQALAQRDAGAPQGQPQHKPQLSKPSRLLSVGPVPDLQGQRADFRSTLFGSLDAAMSGLQGEAPAGEEGVGVGVGEGEPFIKLPPLDPEAFGLTDQPRVHSGFKEAYLSVRTELMDAIDRAAGGRLLQDGWRVSDSLCVYLGLSHASDVPVAVITSTVGTHACEGVVLGLTPAVSLPRPPGDVHGPQHGRRPRDPPGARPGRQPPPRQPRQHVFLRPAGEQPRHQHPHKALLSPSHA
jgi:hypothetical protein